MSLSFYYFLLHCSRIRDACWGRGGASFVGCLYCNIPILTRKGAQSYLITYDDADRRARHTRTHADARSCYAGHGHIYTHRTRSGGGVTASSRRLLSMVIGIVVPRHPGLFRLINAHLSLHAADENPTIASAAQFCLHCLVRTQQNKNRKHPPSRDEIMCMFFRFLPCPYVLDRGSYPIARLPP